MRTLGVVAATLLAGLVLASCGFRRPESVLPVPRGWVAWDRVQECLGGMMLAPMPVHYLMPVSDALDVLGRPDGEVKDMFLLKDFVPPRGFGAYRWSFRHATLYLIYSRRTRLVETLVVVDAETGAGQEVVLTREEILSTRVKPGMGIRELYAIMGEPDRVEEVRGGGNQPIDRFWYEPAGKKAPPVYIDVDRKTFKVVFVSTAAAEETGPPSEGQ
jgi:hypothetical protein